jgi:hypothetical protein
MRTQNTKYKPFDISVHLRDINISLAEKGVLSIIFCCPDIKNENGSIDMDLLEEVVDVEEFISAVRGLRDLGVLDYYFKELLIDFLQPS